MIDRDLIKRAIAEDLAGGEDITSVATVAQSAQIVADFVAHCAWRYSCDIARRAYGSQFLGTPQRYCNTDSYVG